MPQLTLISASGFDRPGLTHRLTTTLAAHNARILDIGQAVIHQTVSIGILCQLDSATEQAVVMKDVLFAAHELGLQVQFSPITPDEYEVWVHAQGEPQLIITMFGAHIEAVQLSRLSDSIARHGLNIAIIMRLSGRPSLTTPDVRPRACVELTVRGTPDHPSAFRAELLTMAQELSVDIAIQTDNVFRRNRRLFAFDMDSTLIQCEVIDELAKRAGAGDAVSKVTEAAMRGELDFKASLRKRLSYLNGLSSDVLEDIACNLPVTDGAERLMQTLKSLGYKTAILSGGFSYFGKRLQQQLGIDYVYANELEIVDGKLTGNVLGEIVDGARKAALLKEIAQRENIRIEQTVAVGDGANDLPMLDVAGLGIAFHAKPKVKAAAEQAIDNFGLDGILYLLGMRDREIGS